MTPKEKLREQMQSTEIFITVQDAAYILGKNPQRLREDIKAGRSNLKAIISGTRVLIPREPFIALFTKGE